MKNIGLYFGTFNPIHIGHCIIAQYMLEFTELDEVRFVVTPYNPHKSKNNLIDHHQRLHMVHLAIDGHYKLKVSDIELSLPPPSYTATTLAYVSKEWPECNFALIMGSDNLQTFHGWRNYKWILKHHHLYIYPRIGSDGGALKNHSKVILMKAPIMQISSIDIQKAIKKGKNVSFMLFPKVWEYIEGNNFYKF